MARNFDELKRELLDHRLKLVDWWLAATAIFLTSMSVFMTFFVIVIAIVGYFGFQRFEDIETRAKGHAEEAGRIVEQIKGMHGTAQTLVESMNVEAIYYSDSDKASEAMETVQQNPLIDRARTDAISLQQKGKVEEAIEKWRSIANIVGETNIQIQARAWFSVGYLYSEEDNWEAAIHAYDKALELKPDMGNVYNNRGNAKNGLGQHEAALADYAKAIELKPDMAEAYYNRGNAKNGLGQHEAALADYAKAIELKPGLAEAYYNRGFTKRNLGRLNEARQDYQKALALAQKSGNEGLIAIVQDNLSQLDNDEAP